MKCHHCNALCMETDKICYSCKQPVGGPSPQRASRAQKVGGMFGLIGSMICFFIADHYFPKRPEDSIHVGGLVGGLLGWTIGYAAGFWTSLHSSKGQDY